jgi:GTP cyclohydrolase IA
VAVDTARIEAAVAELIEAIGDDPSRPGLVETPRRVAEAYADFFAGVGVDAAAGLGGIATDRTGELVAVRDLAFRSTCEHHLIPFVGVAHLVYEPDERIAGLGDLARALEVVSSRPQLQERLGGELAEAIATGLSARGALVILDAVHACVTTRGPRQAGSSTLTVAAVGTLTEPVARDRALALVGRGAA